MQTYSHYNWSKKGIAAKFIHFSLLEGILWRIF